MMLKQIRILSLLLVVCILFCMTSSVFAVEEEIDYENLFLLAVQKDNNALSDNLLYAFVHDTRTFINELAFRSAAIQDAVIYDLFSPSLTLEELTTMEYMLDELLTAQVQTQFAKSEKVLFSVLDFAISYKENTLLQAYTDAPTLFAEAMTLAEHRVEAYAWQLAQTLKGDPKAFIVSFAKEDTQVQQTVLFFWQYISYEDALAWVVWDLLEEEKDRAIQQTDYLSDEAFSALQWLSSALNPLAQVPSCIDPDPEELQQWLAQKNNPSLLPPDYVMEDDYDTLFAFTDDLQEVKFEKLYYAMLSAPVTFFNELAFRDAETKAYILDVLTSVWTSYEKNTVMLELTSRELGSEQKTKSEQALLEYVHYRLSYVQNLELQPHRDFQTLFEEARTFLSDGTGYSEGFSYSVAQAFKADPKEFIVFLAQEDPEIQEFVAASLIYHPNDISLMYVVLVVLSSEIEKANQQVDYFKDAETELISLIRKKSQPTPSRPYPSDPDPKELEQWLEQKYPPLDEPSIIFPISTVPAQTLPATESTEETIPVQSDAPQKDTGWISTICFIIAAFAAGIAVGCCFRKKPKSTPAIAPAEPAAPAVTYPNRAYCPAPLDPQTRTRITQALREKYQEYSIDWYGVKNPDGTCRCYGTDGGYDILFYAGGFRLEIPASCTVAEVTFHFGTTFELYAYRDGTLTELDAAYQNGFVGREAIAAAAALHQNTYKEDTL